MSILDVTAEVLEKAAHYLDAIEQDRESAVKAEKVKVANDLKSKFQSLLGEEFDENMINKLANADNDVVALFNKVANTVHDSASLGGPSEVNDTPTGPLTKEEQMKLANDRFEAWLTS